MIDFHTHTFLSDGVLSPAEHIRRAYVKGYKVLGITDHVDSSNLEFVYESICKIIDDVKESMWDIKIIPGIEITHVPAKRIEKVVFKARELKIPLIILHGETVVEPVEKGTNIAGIEAQVDIIAHPGLITEAEVIRAKELGVHLEITTRRGHSLTNGLVAKLATKYDVKLVLNSDAHSPDDYLNNELRKAVLLGAGIDENNIIKIENNISNLSNEIMKRFKQ